MAVRASGVMKFFKSYWLLIAIALVIVLMWKNIKKFFDGLGAAVGGLGDTVGLVGDILGSPAKIAEWLNKDQDASHKALIKKTLWEFVSEEDYDPEKLRGFDVIMSNDFFTRAEKELYLKEWHKPKGISNILPGGIGTGLNKAFNWLGSSVGGLGQGIGSAIGVGVGFPLKMGSKGPNVSRLQTILNGRSGTKILVVDGMFGANTAMVLRAVTGNSEVKSLSDLNKLGYGN